MLKRFWFATRPGFGYGVTALSRIDAESLLKTYGYPRENEIVYEVVEDIAVSDLDANHVLPNAGPHIVRGVWFPMHNL
jgi:hypothetical protein